MSKKVLWHEGVKNMVNKRRVKHYIDEVSRSGSFTATKSNFILLSKRADLGGWRNAVEAVVRKNDVDDALKTLRRNSAFKVNKSELRRAANLL